MKSTKIALVTGGSRGLGRNAALHLARQGVAVILTYRSQRADAESTVAQIAALGGHAVALPLDVAQSSSFAAFAGELKTTIARLWQRQTFDYLVNNAGIGINAPFAETSEAQFDELVKIHPKGAFFLSQAPLPLIADGGRNVPFGGAAKRPVCRAA